MGDVEARVLPCQRRGEREDECNGQHFIVLTYLFPCRASELYAYNMVMGRFEDPQGLWTKKRRFLLLLGTTQLTLPALWKRADRVEVRFKL